MIIKYIHESEPNVEKTYDTVKALKNNPFIDMTQEKFDRMEINKMQHDENIISFEIVKGMM